MAKSFLFLLWVLAGMLLAGSAFAEAPVVVDGKTATQVNTDSSGHITVQIAPVATGVTGDISHNSYSNFNIPKAGLDLDNRVIDARTIVNEVTSSNPSLIQGKLEVLGNQAHVIIANPNGITVDGGKFVNTGGMILTTGSISYKDTQVTPITTKRDTVITTNGGTIAVEGDGMSGLFNNLELIAKQISINGKVINNQPLEGARTQLIAGSTVATVDSSVSVVDNVHPWLSVAPTDAQENNAILINMGSLGSITSSRIMMAVTDKGAGVKLAGNLAATAQDFTLDSSGTITIAGGKVTTAGDAVITAGDFINEGTRGSDGIWQEGNVTAGGGLLIKTTSGGITNKGGTLQGNVRIAGNSDSIGGVSLVSAGTVDNISVAKDALGIMFATNDDLSVTAKNRITNNTGRLLSNKNVNVTSSEDEFYNIIEKQQIENEGEKQEYSYKDGSFLFKTRKVTGWRVSYGDLLIDGANAYVNGGEDVTIHAKNIVNTGGDIYAQNGKITLDTGKFTTEAILSGTAYIQTGCGWTCRTKGDSSFAKTGGNISASGDVVVNATNGITNSGGQFLSTSGNVVITSPKPVINNDVPVYQFEEMNRGIKSLLRGDYARILRSDQGGNILANMGYVKITSDSPVVMNGGVIEAESQDIAAGVSVVRTSAPTPSAVTGNHTGLLDSILRW